MIQGGRAEWLASTEPPEASWPTWQRSANLVSFQRRRPICKKRPENTTPSMMPAQKGTNFGWKGNPLRIENPDLLAYFRSRPCEICGARPPSDPEHVFPRGLGDANRLDIRINLVSLCRACHTRAHSGHGEPTRGQLKALVARRERMSVEAVQEQIWAYQRMPKEAEPCRK